MNYQHFNHHHLLISLQLEEGEKIYCKACERLCFEPFHGCIACNYYLHDQCLNTPRWLEHPSHPSHSLTLFPSPTYSSGSYTCNACGSDSNAFSLSCAECEFDLHVHCANLPSTLLLDAHPHELKLTFDFPYDENTTCTCDVCGGEVDRRYWLYYCADCDFGTHLDCATSHERPELNQATTDEVSDQLGTDQPSVTDDGLNSVNQVMNDMLKAQVEMAKLQNQINISRAMAQLSFRPYSYR